MKSNQTKHMLYSLIITCVVEFVFVTLATDAAVQIAETRMVVLLFVLSGILLFALIFRLFERKTYKYIEKISDAVRNISAGDLTTRLDVKEDDELSEMAMNLNHMTQDIMNLMDRERESERSKNELITNVAHDLRTPLTSIIGYLELLSVKKDLSDEQKNQYINIAFVKARKLQQLIEDLFGFTKLNYGKIAMKVGKVDIVKLLSQLMDEFYPAFMEKDLQFELTGNVPSAVINADANLLARLFDNLINNAIKYGAEGKQIKVRIDAHKYDVTVSVINYGKVIPADELPMIFEKFYRVEQSRNKETGGTGLGLAIAKNIVDMHGGKIRVESDLHGTRFIVILKTDFDINKENFDND